MSWLMCVRENTEHSDLISLMMGIRGTDWGISKSCEKCHRSSAQVSFCSPPAFCHGCRRGARQTPEVSIIGSGPRGRKKSHYICCQTKSLSGESIARVQCWIPRNTSDASSLPAARKPGCHSNEWSRFHSDLRQRGATLASFVLTKLPCVDIGRH